MRELLAELDWYEELQDLGTEDSWGKFKERLNTVVDECVPKKKRRTGQAKPLWMQQNVLRLIRKKRRLWSSYQKTREFQSWQAYRKVQAEVTKAVRNAKKKFERKLARNSKSNPRAMYSYINKKTSTRAKVGPLKDSSGKTITDDDSMASILNTFFSSVFTKEDLNNLPDPPVKFTGEVPLSTLHVCPEKVEEKLGKLKVNGAPGPDSVLSSECHTDIQERIKS